MNINFNIEKDVPLLIVLGQSNAHGYGTKLPADEQITVPMKNVFGLSCDYNQTFMLEEVRWSGFVTHDMNLGETMNHTFCLAERVARMWQNDIDNGKELPNLYIIQISISGQGIAENEAEGSNMWYPHRTAILNKGESGEADISLYPLTMHILTSVLRDITDMGKNPKIIGLHWNQWETEVWTGGDAIVNAESNYSELFGGFSHLIKDMFGVDFPLYLYYPISEIYENPNGLKAMQDLFMDFQEKNDNIEVIDIRKSSLYDDRKPNKGIFGEDCVHYSPSAHSWFAEYQYKKIFGQENNS